MTCREFANFIIDYASDKLPMASRAEFERHLDICTNCQRYLRAYEEGVKLGRHAFDSDGAEVPDSVPQELVDAILAARRSR